jgi:hypothetical protein
LESADGCDFHFVEGKFDAGRRERLHIAAATSEDRPFKSDIFKYRPASIDWSVHAVTTTKVGDQKTV